MSIQTFKFPSRSDEGEHTVTVGANNHVSCTCRGFRSPSKCWHVREVAERLGLPHGFRSTTPALPFAPDPPLTPTDEPFFFVEPMLGRALKESETIDQWVGRTDWSLEEKYDGHRIQLHVMPSRRISALSRDQNQRSQDFGAHLHNELSAMPAGVYDCELFIPGKKSTHVTRKDMKHRQRLAVFDIIGVYDEQKLKLTTHLSLHDRRKLITVAMSQMSQTDVFQSPVHVVTPNQLAAIWMQGGEGVMLKNNLEVYRPGQRSWVKFKKMQVARVKVTGFLSGKLGPHSRIVAVDEHGIEVRCKALDTKMREAFDQDPDIWIGRTLVIEYQEKTDDGRYRHPRADHFE